MLEYEEWYEENEGELSIYFAETGMDREGDFDKEREMESLYQEYLMEDS